MSDREYWLALVVGVFFQIPAAWICAQLRRPAAIAIVVATSIGHAALGTSVVGSVVP